MPVKSDDLPLILDFFWIDNRYFFKGFWLKNDDLQSPGLSRPGPALKIDTFQKDFNWKSMFFWSPASPDPARGASEIAVSDKISPYYS